MSRLKLLILDANVVIYLHELGIWQKLIAACDVYLARTVVDEVVFCKADDEKDFIDLADDVRQGRIHVFDVSLTGITRFREQFDPVYFGELDPGETESLAYLMQATERFLISSGDAIVYRVLGRLNRGDQGISLDEVLQKIGLQRVGVSRQFQKAFREQYTKQGGIDAIQGMGLKHKEKR